MSVRLLWGCIFPSLTCHKSPSFSFTFQQILYQIALKIQSLTFRYLHFSLDSDPICTISNIFSVMKLFLHHFIFLAHNVHFEYNRAKDQSTFSLLDPLTRNFFIWCYSLPWNCTKLGLVHSHSLICCISSINKGNAFLLFSKNAGFIIKGCLDLWVWDPLLFHL